MEKFINYSLYYMYENFYCYHNLNALWLYVLIYVNLLCNKGIGCRYIFSHSVAQYGLLYNKEVLSASRIFSKGAAATVPAKLSKKKTFNKINS
jgi:hypothetical protein